MQKLRNTYDGASIAVIGSAPSATQYSGLEDIAIGVNGAGQLLSPTDLFFSNDERAYNRSWFLNLDSRVHCILRAQAAVYSEKLYPDERTRLHYQRSYESYMDTNPPSLKVIDSGFRFVLAGDPIVDKLFSTLPDPAPPAYRSSQSCD